MLNDPSLLPLEQYLFKHSSSMNKFPHRKSDYFEKYVRLKAYMKETYFDWSGAGASQDGNYYTDHGITHIETVIQRVGELLACPSDDELDMWKCQLRPYEVFQLLAAILAHDAGMASGRPGHEKAPFKILQDAGNSIFNDTVEIREIAQIASAHSGKIKNNNEDTIKTLKIEGTYDTQTYRPKLLAALLRFADEISDGRSRTTRQNLERATASSQIFHQYAYAITSVTFNPKERKLRIDYDILQSEVVKRFDKGQNKIYLIDEILNRLEKLNLERIYCQRYMADVAPINEIRATIRVLSVDSEGNDFLDGEPIAIDIRDEGYPTQIVNLRELYPHLQGDKFAAMFAEGGTK
jgi:hypothetical protein